MVGPAGGSDEAGGHALSSGDTTPAASPPAPEARRQAGGAASVPPPPSGSAVARISEAAALGLAAALMGSLPAALRVSRAGGSLVGGWLAAAAVVLPALALLVYLSHAAGRGYRMLTGQGAGRSTALGLALWAGMLAPALMAFGTLLKEKTNHRGLGGATFGVVGLVLAGLAALVARRLVLMGKHLAARGLSPKLIASGFALIVVGPTLALALPLLRAPDASVHAHGVAAALVDGAIFSVATAVAMTFEPSEELRARARRLGLGAAGAVLVVGFGWLSMSQPLGAALRAGGGLAAALVGGLERWTDRDGDGVGAAFGGRDCDEGDPRRHPGARDVPNDGVDQDCDGRDGPADAGAGAAAAAEARRDLPAAPAGATPAASPAPPPTIVVVTLDTVRADWTSAYGFDRPTTPRLAALAERGVLFEHALAPGTDTQRALIHLFSGRPLEATPRDRREWPTLKDEVESVAERLRAAGYATAGVSSFRWLSRERGFAQGFEHFVEVFEEEHPERGVTGPIATRAARALLEKLEQDPRPLYLWVHLFDAHEQYKRHAGLDFGKGKRGAYLGEIAFVDRQLGEIADALAKSRRGAGAALIVHGSHGEAFDEHGASGHGRNLHQEALRVPLVLDLPGDSGASRYAQSAVSTLDVSATVLALAGLEPPAGVGRRLDQLARSEVRREPVFARTSKRFAVVDLPLKLVLEQRKGDDRTLLFDLGADPGETKDLSRDRAGEVTRLVGLLRREFPELDAR